MTPAKSAVLEAAEPAKQEFAFRRPIRAPSSSSALRAILSRRKLVPALYGLAAQNCLARRFAIIGFSRTPMTDEAFQNSAVDSVKKFADANTLREAECKEFAQRSGLRRRASIIIRMHSRN